MGTWGNGILRSVDDGESWQGVNQELGHIVTCITVNDSDNVFAGTANSLYRFIDDDDTGGRVPLKRRDFA